MWHTYEIALNEPEYGHLIFMSKIGNLTYF